MLSNYVVLWHGTKRSSALSIAKTGFYAGSFFAGSMEIARGRAKAKGRSSNPGVLVLCAIDLNSYRKCDYERSNQVYRFIAPVPKSAVAGIFRIGKLTRSDLKKKADRLRTRLKLKGKPNLGNTRTKRRRHKGQDFRHRGPEIVITRNCGPEGLVYWINTYLGGYVDGRIEATHPGIEQIRMWVEKNYVNGRISPISDREMLMQTERYIPELSGNNLIAN